MIAFLLPENNSLEQVDNKEDAAYTSSVLFKSAYESCPLRSRLQGQIAEVLDLYVGDQNRQVV